MIGRVTAALVAATASVGLIATSYAAGTHFTPPPRTHWMRTECPTSEFATNCAYNGSGHAYYSVTRKVYNLDGVWNGRRVTCVFYPERKLDREFSACHLLPKGD